MHIYAYIYIHTWINIEYLHLHSTSRSDRHCIYQAKHTTGTPGYAHKQWSMSNKLLDAVVHHFLPSNAVSLMPNTAFSLECRFPCNNDCQIICNSSVSWLQSVLKVHMHTIRLVHFILNHSLLDLWNIYPYPSGLLHWILANSLIAPACFRYIKLTILALSQTINCMHERKFGNKIHLDLVIYMTG